MRCAAASLVLALAAMHSAADTPTWQELAQSANVAQSEGHWAAAEQLIQNAWTALRHTAGEAEFVSGVQAVVSFYNNEGLGLKAEAILREAELAVAQLPPQHPNRVEILNLKAQTYGNQGRLVEAATVYEQLEAIQSKTYGPDSMEVRGTLEMLGNSYDRSGELEKAEALFERLDSTNYRPAIRNSVRLTIDGTLFGGESRFGVIGSSRLAEFYERHGRFADAEKAHLAAIARAEREDGANHQLEPALVAYQNYLRNHRRFAEAQRMQARIRERHRTNGNPPDPNQDFADRVEQAQLYIEADQYEEANKVYQNALTQFGADSSQYPSLQQNYASILIQQGKLDQAEAMVQEIDQHATSDPDDYTHDSVLSLREQISEKAGDQKGAEAYRAELDAIQSSRNRANDPNDINEDIANAQTQLSQGNVDQAWSRIDHALMQIDSEGLQAIGYLGQLANLTGAFPQKDGELVEQLIERIQGIQDRTLPATHPLYNLWLIANYGSHGHPPDSARIWSKHILAIENANGPDSIRLVDPLMQLANVLQAQQSGREAVNATRRVLDIQEKTSGPNSEVLIATLHRLGSLYFDLGNATAAMVAYEREIGMSRRLYGASRNHASNLVNAAQSYSQWHQFDRAIELAGEAVQIISNPEYASELETFRNVLATIEKQKSAAKFCN